MNVSLTFVNTVSTFHGFDFSFDKSVERMLGSFKQLWDCVERAEKSRNKTGLICRIEVESSLNWIKLLPESPYDFSFVFQKKVGSCRNRLKQFVQFLFDYCTIFQFRHWSESMSRQKSEPFTQTSSSRATH